MNIQDPRKNLNQYARYSSIAIQMIIIIILGVFGGYYLDQWLHTGPVFTVVLSLLSVAMAIYVVIKDLLRKPNKP